MTTTSASQPDLPRLQRLITAKHPAISIVTHEEPCALELVKAAAREAGMLLRIWSVTQGVRNALVESVEPEPDSEHPAAALYYFSRQMFHPALCVTLDLSPHLDDQRTLRILRECINIFRAEGSTLIMVDHEDRLPSTIGSASTLFEISLPDDEEIELLVRDQLRSLHRDGRIEVSISRSAYRNIIRNLRGLSRSQISRIITDIVADDRRLNDDDINHVLAGKRQALSRGGVLTYIETPTSLSEIGGLERLKSWLHQRSGAMSDEARDFGLSAPRGLLLLGVQGAGKSLCAKAIATAWQRPLLRMDPGALYDRYIGESERRLRETLRQAEQMAPIILWIDEIEKGFASAASHSTDGGLSRRMFGTLLTWMQDHRAPVFIVATANDIEALPPELLRKGRFDEIFFVDLPRERVRCEIFAIHLRKRGRDPEQFDLEALSKASPGYSGAEIEQAIISAMLQAYSTEAKLDTRLICEALKESPPLSVTMAEKVHQLRAWAAQRCAQAN